MLITSTRNLQPGPDRKGTEKAENPSEPSLMARTLEVIDSTSIEVDKRPVLATALAAGASVARSFKAFPGFVYPSVYNATPAERQLIHQVLDMMPLHHVNDIKAIEVVAEIHNHNPGYVTNGRAFDFHATNHVELSRRELSNPSKWLRTQLHEAGHAVDYESQPFKLFGERSSRSPFGRAPYITDYATTNPKEDFAESYEEFFVDREHLKQKAPEKYEAIKELAEPSFFQRLVDRKEFRETGKYLAYVIGPSKPTRHAVQTGYYLSSLLQVGHGVSQWVRSKESGDPMTHVSGVLNTLAGSLFFSGMTPLAGMAVQGANQALQGAVKRNRLSPEEVESSVSFVARPVESLLGRRKTEIESDHRPGRVAAVAVGGAVGGAAGGFLGPYAGVLAGYHLAGGLGGAVGMVAGGLVGFVGGSEVGGRLGGLADDLVRRNSATPEGFIRKLEEDRALRAPS